MNEEELTRLDTKMLASSDLRSASSSSSASLVEQETTCSSTGIVGQNSKGGGLKPKDGGLRQVEIGQELSDAEKIASTIPRQQDQEVVSVSQGIFNPTRSSTIAAPAALVNNRNKFNPMTEHLYNNLTERQLQDMCLKSEGEMADMIPCSCGSSLTKGTLNETTSSGLHLFVLVHGFQGNSLDLRLIRNLLA
ncbi:unnamed protein product, partial [Amoebophrya sp. A25]|eukprot:GSA25T00023512001.1